MKKSVLVILITLLSSAYVFSQGILRGNITDEKGDAMYGVRVISKIEKKVATSDFDGNYSLKIDEVGQQSIYVIFSGYDTIVKVINPLNNEVIISNFNLEPTVKVEGEVTVTARQVKANDIYLEKKKINSAGTIDYISAETMKKTGDPNVATAVSRVSGVSTNGGLITVRGIGDRYVKTTLNGSRIPTLDPLTNNIKLDIFPSSLVDNIIITKTASPDLPGDWSGAYLSVETKDYPDKLLVNVESQFGYNEQTTFKDVLSSQRSSTDWLGFDNGLRNRKDLSITTPNLNPTSYQEMVALGLGSYYSSMGITGWTDGSQQGDTYFRLGLVQLGILPKALINDDIAYNNARNKYNTVYKEQAFEKINPEGTNYNNGFANDWNLVKRRAPMNFSQSFSIGNQVTLFGKPLGYLIGFRYGNSIRYDANGISQRVGAEELNYQFETQDNAQISRETDGWSGLCNLAYKLNDKNKISALYMPNYTGTNDVASYKTIPDANSYQEGRTQNNQFYEQRKQQIYQLKSEHFLPKSKTKIDFNSSYTRGNSIAPDFKVLQYGFVKNDGEITSYQFSPSAGEGIRRYYRNLSENIFDSRLSAELPIADSSCKLIRKLKFGAAYQRSDRKSDLNEYYLSSGNNNTVGVLTNDDIDSYLNQNKFTVTDHTLDFFYSKRDFARNHTFGFSSIKAAFLMLDYEFIPLLRFSGGLRVEQGKIFSDVDEYYAKGYGRNDIRRENVGGFSLINTANINETNFLPSANLIYKLNCIDSAKTNLRFNYSQTVARPSIRELNDGAIYDNEFRTLIYGNSDLKIVHIKNFDFRAETYLKNGDNLSVSLFYKDFRNHIEMGFGTAGVTWQNIDKSNVGGIEFEGKKMISKSFELRANVTLVKSNSVYVRKDMQVVEGLKVFTPVDTINRPMFGQAPYIINGMFSYKADSIGLVATLSYNVQGPRLVITGVVKGRPDVYEIPRHTIDFKVSKTLGEFFSVSITVRDLLNAPVRRAYKLPTGWVDYDRFRYGTNFIVGLSYKL